MKKDAHQKNRQRLSKDQQQSIALDALSNKGISKTANDHQVARNTVYSHKSKATKAITEAYHPKKDDVLFYLPVTKEFIAQIIVSLYLICKASIRDSMQFLLDCLDYSVSLGHVCNTLDDANLHGMVINDSYDLSPIKRAASDEVFHRNAPILATVDIPSRYCASLSKQKTRCQDAWGCELIDLQAQGFNPNIAVIDGALGLKAGYEQALPNTTLVFDHFHITQDAKDLVRYLNNHKESKLKEAIKASYRRDKAKVTTSKSTLTKALNKATAAYECADLHYQTTKTLVEWFQFDVLPFTSVPLDEREDLYGFIVQELQVIATYSHRIQTFVNSLVNQRGSLMKALQNLDTKFKAIAKKHQLPIPKVWEIAELAKYGFTSATYHTKSDLLDQEIGPQFDAIEDEVLTAIDETDRTSCMVENFNSRLSPYLDERKGFKDERLSLIQFGLNHRPFMRSEHKALVGKTPAQVMSGINHPHWLEMLGFKRFQLAA